MSIDTARPAETSPVPAPPATSARPSMLRRLMAFEITKKKVPRRDLMHFSRQLSVFVRAGIPMLEALDTI
ncbi:MAG: hypothetical protein ACRDLR_09600, partial [Gaiellaceae bacterium]